LSNFTVHTNDTMTITLTNGSQTDSTNSIPISHGINGFAQPGQATTGDKKTPLGNWKILEIRQSPDNEPVYSKTGSNMGAAFFLLSPMINGERGIGMHGNKNGTLGSTYGCIRLKNADILALLPYVKVGTSVIITN
jgi:lipoprotein-anchoring transpeptidase ErfK/SrfK